MKRPKLLCIALIALMLLTSCSLGGGDGTSSDPPAETAELETEIVTVVETRIVEKTVTYYLPEYREISFVPEETKETWREPLVRLLSTMKRPVWEKSGGAEEEGIEYGLSVALLDISMDGTPELIVDLGGGSSGNGYFHAYDLMSGELVYTFSGSAAGGWSHYFSMRDGRCHLIASYQYRFGWQELARYIREMHCTDGVFTVEPLFYSTHEIDAVRLPDEETNTDGTVIEYWDEIHPAADYYAYGEEVMLEDFFYLYDVFQSTYIRLPETDMTMVDWYKFADLLEDREEFAVKTADALLSTGQEFLLPTD